MLEIGAVGIISVTANILPKVAAKLFKLGTVERFKHHKFMYEIHNNMFIER